MKQQKWPGLWQREQAPTEGRAYSSATRRERGARVTRTLDFSRKSGNQDFYMQSLIFKMLATNSVVIKIFMRIFDDVLQHLGYVIFK